MRFSIIVVFVSEVGTFLSCVQMHGGRLSEEPGDRLHRVGAVAESRCPGDHDRNLPGDRVLQTTLHQEVHIEVRGHGLSLLYTFPFLSVPLVRSNEMLQYPTSTSLSMGL